MLEEQGDWRQYEDYTRKILNDERTRQYIKDSFCLSGFTVKPKKKLDGKKTGTQWEVDGYGYDTNNQLILIECKHYNSRFIEQNTVAAFAYIIQDIGAKQGIIVTTLGLQAGAVRVAKAENIGLIKLHYNSTDQNFFVSFNSLDQPSKENPSTSLGSFTDEFNGISFAASTAIITTIPILTSYELEKVLERLKKRENRTNFSNEEILEEVQKMQKDYE